jgi:Pentapeptide repeats (8 copies)
MSTAPPRNAGRADSEPPAREPRARSEWFQILATTVVGLLSVVAVMAGVIVTNAQNRAQQRLDEQGQVTERFGRAVELLGSHELDVRIGGIYALERLIYDSPDDKGKIVEVLSAFIRDHTPESLPAWSHADTSPCRSAATTPKGRPSHPPNDAQAALTVLGRRLVPVGNDLNNRDPRINLTWADIAGASLNDANLDHADLRCTGLTRAHLDGAHLRDAALRWAYLTNAHLKDAHLRYAHLPYADLTGADLRGADLTGADLTGTIWPADTTVPKGWLRDSHSGRLKPSLNQRAAAS